MQLKIRTINTNQGKIEYSITGYGKPVLFLHGGHSNCRETLFHKGFDIGKFQLITPSRPGYGNTPLKDNETPRQAADLIIALLDSLNIYKVTLYAISAGGLTAIELAGNYPERFEKLIMASAVSKKWLDENGKVYKTAQHIFNPSTEKIVWGMIRWFSRLLPNVIAKQFYPQFTSNNPHKLSKDDIRELLSTFRHYSSKTGFICDINHNIDDDVISKIICPTLIIHSKNDNSVSFEHAEYANKMIKDSKLAKLNNEWGHLFWIGNDSNESIRKTIDFIELQNAGTK
jgi:pimeloyl-ACP methyl ester carboxylesterase